MSEGARTTVRMIFDTNIWLDWFVFAQSEDSPIAQLKQFIAHTEPTPHILMTTAMWTEWVDVLGRAQFAVDASRQAQILAMTRELVHNLPDAPPPYQKIRCSDKDDQVFIDSALLHGVDWLISKDKHLLNLRHRASKFGVAIATPEVWAKQMQSKANPEVTHG